jgi:lysophospholipase L1-like esterase
MKKIIFLIFVLISGNPLFAQEKQIPEFSTYYYQKKSLFEALPDTKKEIIFLGNSITDGGEWWELFKNPNIKNRGISGDITDGVLFRMDEVLSSKPVKIFIMIGINDLAAGKTPDYILINYSHILAKIKEASPKTDVYVQSILPVNKTFGMFPNHTDKGEKIKEINKGLKEMAINFEYQFIDLTFVFSDKAGRLNEEYTNDGLHLMGKGYLVWKDAIKKYIGERSQ